LVPQTAPTLPDTVLRTVYDEAVQQITTLTTENGDIKISPECSVYGVTNLPDYYSNYSVSGTGIYVINLTAGSRISIFPP